MCHSSGRSSPRPPPSRSPARRSGASPAAPASGLAAAARLPGAGRRTTEGGGFLHPLGIRSPRRGGGGPAPAGPSAGGAIIQPVEPFKPLWPKLLALGGALALVVLVVVPFILSSSRTSGVHRPYSDLRTIAGAQAAFREKTSAGRAKKGYWRVDLASLYAQTDSAGQPIGLISLALAAADDRPAVDLSPAVRSPKSGYWFRSLPFEGGK
jgi:hypothetical protein